MSAAEDPQALLQFEPPDGDARDWLSAERKGFQFPARLVEKARELADCRQELQKAWDDNRGLHDRLFGFVLRNLISVADICKGGLVLASVPAPAGEPVPADTPAAENHDGPAATARATLASAERMVLYILEELGVHRVDLLGKTYDAVAFNGRPVADPFEVLESSRTGKASEVPVREVVEDLWVLDRDGSPEVVRKGRVNC